MKRAMLIGIMSLWLVACGTTAATLTPAPTATPAPTPTITPIPPCTTNDGKKVYDLLVQFAQEWDDAAQLVNNTPRTTLAPQIARMQEVRRKVQAQAWPRCGQAAYTLLVEAMDQTIDGAIAFLGQRPNYAAQIQAGNATFAAFFAELQRIMR